MVTIPDDLRFDESGLIPAIAQDAEGGQVLMLAYMNAEALAKTVETGLAHYFSRSRGRLWCKGEESGHVQHVRAIQYDCDEDALLLQVEQQVAACHTGHRSCFYRALSLAAGAPPAPERAFDPARVYRGLNILSELYATIQERRAVPAEGSYVAALFAKGPDQPLKKLAEEAGEVLLAAKNADRRQLVYEMADLWFHSLAVLAQHDIRPEEVAQELGSRVGKRKPEYGGNSV
ncbi:MAG TPA: bifunctional phosphoribosyl-AMP cyclohydrolase/phosphoribosyl-ATP diphosphatase HisIE [Candidatus Baltobacteraceae bacterium]|nr:bifunctional phosphoribosyl-AMP cyclohydrolase/phosphoribosyl-ATP diphosphatase HisIE [Candidatus Baltobacteraceae bacterium]